MTKRAEIEEYLLERRRGDIIQTKWLRYDLWDKAHISASRSTVRTVLASMETRGFVDKWGGGRSTRWYIRKKARGQ